MGAPLELSAKNLAELARGLAAGAVPLSEPRFALQRRGFSEGATAAAVEWLASLHREGWTNPQAARFAGALAEERDRRERARDDIELVWTGPEGRSAENRDSARVLEELFQAATASVLLCGYNVQRGDHFDALVAAMRAHPRLRVRLFAHVFTDDRPSLGEALGAHDGALRSAFGPSVRGRMQFYRPSEAYVLASMERRFSVHAKCVVVDRRRVLVTSANFSVAAQERNIEVGITMDDPRLAGRLTDHFDALVVRGDMEEHRP